jgi:hypothetical protein
MKRLTILALVFTLILPIVSAGTFDEIFNEYKNMENAEYVKIPKFLMKLAGNKAEVPDDLPIKGKVSGMRILNITDIGNDTGKRINDSAKNLAAKNNMQEMLRHTSDGEECRIWFSMSKDKVKEIYLLYTEPDEVSLLEFTGNFRLTD